MVKMVIMIMIMIIITMIIMIKIVIRKNDISDHSDIFHVDRHLE